MPQFLIQLIGFIGLLFLGLSFQQNNRNRILVFILIGQIIFILHFALLGAWTAAGVNSVGAIRTLLFRFRDERSWAGKSFWPWVFIFLFGMVGWASWDGWLSLLPVVAMSIETVGLWMRNTSRIRLINLFPHPLWFTYNLVKGSWAGVATEVFIFLSILVAIIRFDILKREKSNSNTT